MPNKKINYGGKEFNSQAALAKFLKVSPSILGLRIRENLPESSWGEKKVIKRKLNIKEKYFLQLMSLRLI